MRVIFKVVRFKNFLGTGNHWTEINLAASPQTLIIGANGHGKSQFIEAIVFAIYNSAYRKANKPELINSINDKDCVVELEFSVNETEYKIIRGQKPAIFEVYCDGEKIPFSDAKTMQENIEKNILKMSYKVFIQIVVLGNAAFIPFMSLSAADRRAVIESLLSLQIFSVMNVLLKKKIQDAKDNISATTTKIIQYQSQENMLKNQIESLTQDRDSRISELNERIQVLIDENEQFHDDHRRETEAIGKLSFKNISALEKKIQNLKSMESVIDNKKAMALQNAKFFEDNDFCVTCSQPIGPEHKHEMIQTFQATVQKMQEGLERIVDPITAAEDELKEARETEKLARNIQTELALIQSKMNTNASMRQRLQKEIDDLKNAPESSLSKTEALLIQNNAVLDQEIKLRTDATVQLNHFEYILLLLKDDGLKAKIINKYIPIINAQVNSYLSIMDLFVGFQINEQFEESFKARYRDKFSYGLFSQGQKARIDLALLLTWRDIAKLKNSVSTNLLIMDEVFDGSLDDNGVDHLMKILDTLKDQNVLVISHKERFVDKFPRVIKFEMKNNFCTMSEVT